MGQSFIDDKRFVYDMILQGIYNTEKPQKEIEVLKDQ